MSLPRMRLTVWRMMILVAVTALAIWAVAEVLVYSPTRQRASQLTAHHEIRLEIWNTLADASEHESNQNKECRRLAGWHEGRIQELRGVGIPSDRIWWEEGDRMTRYELGFFNQIGGTGLAPVNYNAF